MTINDLFETLDFSSYDKIVVHWPWADQDESDATKEYHEITFDFADAVMDLFGHVHIMTMDETGQYDGGDGSLYIVSDSKDGIAIHIYLRREDIISWLYLMKIIKIPKNIYNLFEPVTIHMKNKNYMITWG